MFWTSNLSRGTPLSSTTPAKNKVDRGNLDIEDDSFGRSVLTKSCSYHLNRCRKHWNSSKEDPLSSTTTFNDFVNLGHLDIECDILERSVNTKSCPQAWPALHFFWQLATPLLHLLSPRHHHGGVAPLRDPGRQAWSFFPCRRTPGLLAFPGCGLGLEYLCLGITAIGGGKNGLWSLHDVCDLYYLLRFSFGTERFARMAAQWQLLSFTNCRTERWRLRPRHNHWTVFRLVSGAFYDSSIKDWIKQESVIWKTCHSSSPCL